MIEQIEKALAVKDSALVERDSDTEEALRLVESAADTLDALWEQKKETIEAAGAEAGPDERALVEALAETYGVKGGILRSSGEPERAVRAYDRGNDFERHPAHKVENSYNLVQRLTNRVLAEPREAGAPRWVVESADMWKELEEARSVLRRQIENGGRGNDPWAKADLITVQLLLSARDPEKGEALIDEAYRKFDEMKPDAGVYRSTGRALEDLRAGLEQVPEGERPENLKALLGQLSALTSRLSAGFEEAKRR